ncbi:Uncharacterised protein [Vibrio cholerae]|nr:Uncharacterised protein [Vibrio cholerae]
MQRTRATNETTRPSPNNRLQLGVLHRTNLSEAAGTQAFDFQNPAPSNLCHWLNRPKIDGQMRQTAFQRKDDQTVHCVQPPADHRITNSLPLHHQCAGLALSHR